VNPARRRAARKETIKHPGSPIRPGLGSEPKADYGRSGTLFDVSNSSPSWVMAATFWRAAMLLSGR